MNTKAYAGALVVLACACSRGPATAEPAREAPAKAAAMAEPDACGAWNHQDLVGQPKSAIPPKPEGANWRVHGRLEPVNQDLRPDRMNIVWEETTGRIVEVRCY